MALTLVDYSEFGFALVNGIEMELITYLTAVWAQTWAVVVLDLLCSMLRHDSVAIADLGLTDSLVEIGVKHASRLAVCGRKSS